MKEYTTVHDEKMVEIDWLTTKDANLIKFFDRVHSLSGMWRNKNSALWTVSWLLQMSIFITIYFYSLYFFMISGELEILAHLIHHIVMAIDDFMYIYILYRNRSDLEMVHDFNSKTYNYDSELMKTYHKTHMVERLKLHGLVAKFVVFSAISTLAYLEFFYLLEATILKSYVTMFPIYLPTDLTEPATYSSIVFFQHLQVYITILMVSGLIAILFTAWNHITLELNVLTYAMTHIDDLVKEKLKSLTILNRQQRERAKAETYRTYCTHFARHHCAIVRYFYAFKRTSSVTIFCIFLTGLVCFACVGITTVTENLGIKLKFLFIMILQVAVIYSWCWVGQEVTEKNSNLQEVIAGIPWWKMPKPCHTTLLLIMIGSSCPLHLSTPFGQVANNESFMDMATSSYRIFNLIYQMKFSS